MNPKLFSPRHIIIKLSKIKDRESEAKREKNIVSYKGTLIRLSADFSEETL